jgi:hypothetical protein
VSDQPVNKQLLIAYGRGRASVIYTAAYTLETARAALERCVAAHGRWVCARIVSDLPGSAAAG